MSNRTESRKGNANKDNASATGYPTASSSSSLANKSWPISHADLATEVLRTRIADCANCGLGLAS